MNRARATMRIRQRLAAGALVGVAASVLAVSCADTTTDTAQVPNPASVRCVELGGTSRIVQEDDGAQGGVCEWPDGSSCDEWALYRGECQPPGVS